MASGISSASSSQVSGDFSAHKCQRCGAVDKKLSRCARCHIESYCSRECQKAAWPKHKQVCIINAKTVVAAGIGDVAASVKASTVSEKLPYFDSDEIACLLKSAIFFGEKEEMISEDIWADLTYQRAFVLPALNKGLSEIISRYVRDDSSPIVEIGSGAGYSLPSDLSRRIIRIQPGIVECQSLSQSIPDPIYQLDIEGLYNHLAESKKKIPLFFALNVFDAMSPVRRKTSFAQLSQLQNSGDQMLIMLDTNPLFYLLVEQLEIAHPGHVALPYFPLTDGPSKHHFIIVPLQFVRNKVAVDDLYKTMQKDARTLILERKIPRTQEALHQLQSDFNLKVISVEDFFVDQLKNELKQENYNANVYYHGAFSVGETPMSASTIEYDLVYKSVTDTATIRTWSLKVAKKALADWLITKEIELPNHFDGAFLDEIAAKGQKILGAEILVIEATKI